MTASIVLTHNRVVGRPKIKASRIQLRVRPETRQVLDCIVAQTQGEDMTRFIEEAIIEKAKRDHPDCLPIGGASLIHEEKAPYKTTPDPTAPDPASE